MCSLARKRLNLPSPLCSTYRLTGTLIVSTLLFPWILTADCVLHLYLLPSLLLFTTRCVELVFASTAILVSGGCRCCRGILKRPRRVQNAHRTAGGRRVKGMLNVFALLKAHLGSLWRRYPSRRCMCTDGAAAVHVSYVIYIIVCLIALYAS